MPQPSRNLASWVRQTGTQIIPVQCVMIEVSAGALGLGKEAESFLKEIIGWLTGGGAGPRAKPYNSFWCHWVWLGSCGQGRNDICSTLVVYRWPIHEVLGMFQGACSEGWPQGILAEMRAKKKERLPSKARAWCALRGEASCKGKRASRGKEVWMKISAHGVEQWGLERWRSPGLLANKDYLVLQVLPGAQDSGGVFPASSQTSGHTSSWALQGQSLTLAYLWAPGSGRPFINSGR